MTNSSKYSHFPAGFHGSRNDWKKNEKYAKTLLTVRGALTYIAPTNEAASLLAKHLLLTWIPRKGVASAKTYLELVSERLWLFEPVR